MRITDQYIWNIVFLVFFLCLVFMATVILESESYRTYADLTFTDYALISLATFRFIRLFAYDRIFAFFREQFYDAKEVRGQMLLVKPESGPRRTLADLLSCPWCFGMWGAATVVFFYLLTPYAFFPVLIMAVSGVGTLLQLVANLIGWKAEQAKRDAGE